MLRIQLGTHVVIHSDINVNQHFARNLTRYYSVQKNIVLAKEESSRKVFEDVVLNTYGEMEMAKGKGTRYEKGHALFVADSGCRGNEGGGTAGRGERGRGKRGKGRGGRQDQQQQHPQQ